MTQRHCAVLTLLAVILNVCTIAAPLPTDAASRPAVAPPTHLRPVQSKADCATALSLLAFIWMPP